MSGGDSIEDDGFQVPSRRQRNKKAGTTEPKKNHQRQRRSANNHTGKRQPNHAKSKKKSFSAGPSLSSRGWSKPSSSSEGWGTTVTTAPRQEGSHPPATPLAPSAAAPAAASKKWDDAIDAALLGGAGSTSGGAGSNTTTTATTMGSLMASMGFAPRAAATTATTIPAPKPEPTPPVFSSFASFAKGQTMEDLLGDLGEKDPHWKEKQFPAFDEDDAPELVAQPKEPSTSQSFAAFSRDQSTAALLADFGAADPHWKDKVVAEEEEEETTTTGPAGASTAKAAKPKSSGGSRLAPHGKAAIHLSIESFGVAHGAPSRGARDRSGSPFTQPLEWLDVGDSVVQAIPDHLAFHDGLRSGVVKRLLKSAPLVGSGDGDAGDAAWRDDDDDDKEILRKHSVFSAYCREHLAATKIFPALLEAIHEGGHGYASPLTMRIRVGSDLGRHRSVVATEWIAQHLRHLVRTHNDDTDSSGTKKITCSVSVGTVHRDVHKRIPQKHYKEDDEDDLAERL